MARVPHRDHKPEATEAVDPTAHADSRLGRFAPFLALVAVHLLMGMPMEQPIILADELGYLGNAR